MKKFFNCFAAVIAVAFLLGCVSGNGTGGNLKDIAVGSCWQINTSYTLYDYADFYLMLKAEHYAICNSFTADNRDKTLGEYEIFKGDYSFSNQGVTLSYPSDDSKKRDYGWILSRLFVNSNTVELTYDPSFNDFYYGGCLKNDNLVLRNLTNPCKVGGVYELDGISVKKTNAKLTVSESTPLYAEPRFDSACYHYRYHGVSSLAKKGAKQGKEFSKLFLPGLVAKYDARSVQSYTDDNGKKGTWYHVHLASSLIVEASEDNEIEWCWIFTDNIIEITDASDMKVYDDMLEESVTSTGAVIW